MTKSDEAFGPTGRFPSGKLADDDEGEVRFVVLHQDGMVVLDFGSAVSWLGMTPVQARALGEALIQHAKEAGD